MTKTTRTLLGGLLLTAATVGAWWAWLGWESGYTVDPETGRAASTDDTGLWAVGAALVATGTAAGATVVSGGAAWLRRRRVR